MAVVNIGAMAAFVDVPTAMPDGIYRDEVYGREFRVRKGRLKGTTAPRRSYILRVR